MRTLLALLALCVASSAASQTHTPAAAVVEGDTVTIDGSFAWHDPGINSSIAQGSTLSMPGIYANPGGRESIKIKMPPGKHVITVLGFPDAPTGSLRKAVVQEVNIGTPTRQAQLIEVYKAIENGKNMWRLAAEKLDELKPTRAEVVAALQALAAGS